MLYSGTDLIPHKPPMLFIDSVSLRENPAQAYAVVREDWGILDSQGSLPEAAFFEIMAQGFAAICSAKLKEAQKEITIPAFGFLVGLKKFNISGTACLGDKLAVTIQNQLDIGSFSVIEAVLKNERAELLASGQIKVYLAEGSALPKFESADS